MRAVAALLALALFGGCTTTQPTPMPQVPSVPLSEAEQAQRQQRIAYALKAISFIKPNSEMTEELREALKTPAPSYLKQFRSEKRDRAADLWSNVLVPEILGRTPELKEILAGGFADILTIDELRRLAEIVDLPGAVRLQNKQPLTDQDVEDLTRLGLPALAKRLQEMAPTAKELMRARSERWAITVVGDLMRQRPELFAGMVE